MFKSKQSHFFVLLIFVLITILITWPLILKPAQITITGREEYFLSYILNWNIQALTQNPANIFQTPFFYPLKNTLAFSDPLFTSSLIALPFVKIFNQPFLAFSVNTIIAFILNGFFTYLLVQSLTKKTLPAIISGILMSFSIGRLDALEHLQIFTFYWIPLGLYFFLKLVKTNQPRFAYLTSLCFLLQVFNTVFLGFVYLFTIFIFSFVYWTKKKLKKDSLLALFKSSLIAIGLVGLIFLPYLNISKTYHYTRSLKDIWGGSAYFLEYLYPTSHSRLEPLAQKLFSKQPWPAYLGMTISFLGFLSFFFLKKTSQKLSLVLMGISGFFLSLGPYLQITKHSQPIIPLPYLFLYYTIPGFKSMRTPQRWSHLLLFSLAILSGLFLAQVFKKIKLKKQIIISLAIIFLVILEIKQPIFTKPVSTINQIPTVYHWLAKKPPSIVLEIPAQSWVMKLSDKEIERLHYHSFILESQHQFVNGFSGFAPPIWMDYMTTLRKFPQQKSLHLIEKLTTNTIILHHQDIAKLKQLDPYTLSLDKITNILDQLSDYHLAYQDGQTSVYTISRTTTPQAP